PGDVAGHVHHVVAQAADDPRGHAGLRAQHVDDVVAFQGVDLQHLDVRVSDGQAGAEDPLGGDDDVVGDLGAQDDELVEAGAAVHRDGRVDIVLDLVVARAGADGGLGRGREAPGELRLGDHLDRVDKDDVAGDRVGFRQGEGADDEQVVAV